MSDYTKAPWKASGRWVGTDKHKSAVCECFSNSDSRVSTDKSRANARHIVHCVNNHERLVEALVNVKAGLEAKLVGSPEFTLESMIEGVSRALATLEAEKGGEL